MHNPYLPRILIKALVILLIASYAAIRIPDPRSDGQFVALYRLLQWREPSTGRLVPLPVGLVAKQIELGLLSPQSASAQLGLDWQTEKARGEEV